MTVPTRPEVLPSRRSQLELMTAQIAAIDAWNRARRASEAAAEALSLTREMRLDLNRRMEARRREQQALLVRTEQQLCESGCLLSTRSRTRAVLAHRNEWLRSGVADRLQERGVTVVGAFEDGAEVAGTAVAEQPDLVLVEDRLPTLSGIEVVRRIRTFAPEAVVGVQCADSDGKGALVDAGAHAVFTRRVPPRDIADALLECFARV